jgi:hypothetical protein
MHAKGRDAPSTLAGSYKLGVLDAIGTDDFTALPGMAYGANVAVGTFE